MDPDHKGIYENGDLELKCPYCGYIWEYDEDTTFEEFSQCPNCKQNMLKDLKDERRIEND